MKLSEAKQIYDFIKSQAKGLRKQTALLSFQSESRKYIRSRNSRNFVSEHMSGWFTLKQTKLSDAKQVCDYSFILKISITRWAIFALLK